MKYFKIVIWFILTMYLITLGLDMVSVPNTIENIIGCLIVFITIYVSIKTKCFTNIKFKITKNNKGSNSTN
jgi:uncharacterized Tic20 family protein